MKSPKPKRKSKTVKAWALVDGYGIGVVPQWFGNLLAILPVRKKPTFQVHAGAAVIPVTITYEVPALPKTSK